MTDERRLITPWRAMAADKTPNLVFKGSIPLRHGVISKRKENMKVELARPASVRGWCRSKGLIKVTYSSPTFGDERSLWLDSWPVSNTNEEAKDINQILNEIVNKLQ